MEIRRATIDDAAFIAWAVLEARHGEVDHFMRNIEMTCSSENSLYSWRHAFLAIKNNQPVGCLIAYDGGTYLELRNVTFPAVFNTDPTILANLAPETQGGEFYLDTLAVMQEYRHQDIGSRLVGYAIDSVRGEGFHSCTVQCETELMPFYTNLRFNHVGHVVYNDLTSEKMEYPLI